jgi:hypothetical protein
MDVTSQVLVERASNQANEWTATNARAPKKRTAPTMTARMVNRCLRVIPDPVLLMLLVSLTDYIMPDRRFVLGGAVSFWP